MWAIEENMTSLPWVDFSKNSQVRNSLKQMLIIKRNEELSIEDLDIVTAAGAGYQAKDNKLSQE